MSRVCVLIMYTCAYMQPIKCNAKEIKFQHDIPLRYGQDKPSKICALNKIAIRSLAHQQYTLKPQIRV